MPHLWLPVPARSFSMPTRSCFLKTASCLKSSCLPTHPILSTHLKVSFNTVYSNIYVSADRQALLGVTLDPHWGSLCSGLLYFFLLTSSHPPQNGAITKVKHIMFVMYGRSHWVHSKRNKKVIQEDNSIMIKLLP